MSAVQNHVNLVSDESCHAVDSQFLLADAELSPLSPPRDAPLQGTKQRQAHLID